MTTDFERCIEGFEAAGNIVVGRPARISGKCSIHEYKSGSTIVFAEGCTIANSTFQFPKGGGRIEIGEKAQYQAMTHLGEKSIIRIGARTVFNRRCEVHAWEDACITIGADCLFSNIVIRTSDMHSIFDRSSGARVNPARSVVIEDRVWIGEGAMVGKGSRIGSGSVIGARSVVTGYIRPDSVAVGMPAKVVKSNAKWSRNLKPMSPGNAAPTPLRVKLSLWRFGRRLLRKVLNRFR